MNTRIRLALPWLLVVLLFVSIPAASAAPSPFAGHWTAIDVVDGSEMRLTIVGGRSGSYRVAWTESHISSCAGGVGIIRGTGSLHPEDPNVLELELVMSCFLDGTAVGFPFPMTYDPATDTLYAEFEWEGETLKQVWVRPGA